MLVASQNGHEPCVALLLEWGASVDLQGDDGASPLFMASQKGHEPCVALLLKWGASVDLHAPSIF